MPVVLTQPYVPSVPAYDKIHLDHLTISLEKTDYAKTTITARVRPYFQDPVTNVKNFCPDAENISIEDADAWVMSLLAKNDMRGVEAGNHIKAIVSLLVETSTDLGNTSII